MRTETNLEEIVIHDTLIIDLDDMTTQPIAAAKDEGLDISVEGNLDKFREDVANILVSEFEFDVLKEQVKDAKGNTIERLGHCTNRDESLSIYFGVSYDLKKSSKWAYDNMIPNDIKISVRCKVIIKVSNHNLFNFGDPATREYDRSLLKNIDKQYGPHLVTIDEEEVIDVEDRIESSYQKGLDFIRSEIIERIKQWRIKARKELTKIRS